MCCKRASCSWFTVEHSFKCVWILGTRIDSSHCLTEVVPFEACSDRITIRLMNIADGYTFFPPGKIVSVVTYLQMLKPSALRPDSKPGWTLTPHRNPDLNWYRKLFRAVGED